MILFKSPNPFKMKFIEVNFCFAPIEPTADILVAQLSEIDFGSFQEVDTGLIGYIEKEKFNEQKIKEILSKNISFTYSEMPDINWNETWESNFEPILIDDLCAIRATFHKKINTKYEIVINPKMSFGTGHHETTYLMIKTLLELEIENKTVLDMGCGTGILGILASIKGAKNVDGIDIEEWAYENCIENCEINQIKNFKTILGDVSQIKGKKYDLIIANINRNVLLNDLSSYCKSLNKNGIILLSGFYEEDFDLINQEAQKNNLSLNDKKTKNKWCLLSYLNT